MNKVFAVIIRKGNYEQVIYVKGEAVEMKELCEFDELEQAEKEMFEGDVAVFEAEAVR